MPTRPPSASEVERLRAEFERLEAERDRADFIKKRHQRQNKKLRQQKREIEYRLITGSVRFHLEERARRHAEAGAVRVLTTAEVVSLALYFTEARIGEDALRSPAGQFTKADWRKVYADLDGMDLDTDHEWRQWERALRAKKADPHWLAMVGEACSSLGVGPSRSPSPSLPVEPNTTPTLADRDTSG